MSVMYHPDKNPEPWAAAKFDQIRVAYEVLSDKDKRAVYDTGAVVTVLFTRVIILIKH